MATHEAVLRLVGWNVRRRRRMVGISVWEAAEDAGMAPETWRRIEAGTSNFGVKTLAKVCAELGVDATELFEPPAKRS